MQFFKNRTVLGVMCIAAALLICFGITPLFNKSLANKAEIVRVVKQIKSGEKITAVEPAAENAYLYHLDGKKQAISISVKAFANGLSGKLKSGDIVSVIAPDYKKQGTTEILPELKYMEVIAVTASSGNDANTEAQEEGEEKELPGTVTLLAAPEQSKLLAELEAEGKIHLSLVYRGERENAEKFVAAQDSILKGLEKEKDGKDNGQTEDMEVHVTDKLPENDAEAEDTAEESLSADEIQESEESTEEPQEVQEP